MNRKRKVVIKEGLMNSSPMGMTYGSQLFSKTPCPRADGKEVERSQT
jgi:hypothetical protein